MLTTGVETGKAAKVDCNQNGVAAARGTPDEAGAIRDAATVPGINQVGCHVLPQTIIARTNGSSLGHHTRTL